MKFALAAPHAGAKTVETLRRILAARGSHMGSFFATHQPNEAAHIAVLREREDPRARFVIAEHDLDAPEAGRPRAGRGFVVGTRQRGLVFWMVTDLDLRGRPRATRSGMEQALRKTGLAHPDLAFLARAGEVREGRASELAVWLEEQAGRGEVLNDDVRNEALAPFELLEGMADGGPREADRTTVDLDLARTELGERLARQVAQGGLDLAPSVVQQVRRTLVRKTVRRMRERMQGRAASSAAGPRLSESKKLILLLHRHRALVRMKLRLLRLMHAEGSGAIRRDALLERLEKAAQVVRTEYEHRGALLAPLFTRAAQAGLPSVVGLQSEDARQAVRVALRRHQAGNPSFYPNDEDPAFIDFRDLNRQVCALERELQPPEALRRSLLHDVAERTGLPTGTRGDAVRVGPLLVTRAQDAPGADLQRVLEALRTIAGTPIGRVKLRRLQSAGHPVRIVFKPNGRSRFLPRPPGRSTAGVKASILRLSDRPCRTCAWASADGTEALDLTLFHQLLHALFAERAGGDPLRPDVQEARMLRLEREYRREAGHPPSKAEAVFLPAQQDPDATIVSD